MSLVTGYSTNVLEFFFLLLLALLLLIFIFHSSIVIALVTLISILAMAAILFVLLGNDFMFVMYILLYIGAISVFFLFAVMLITSKIPNGDFLFFKTRYAFFIYFFFVLLFVFIILLNSTLVERYIFEDSYLANAEYQDIALLLEISGITLFKDYFILMVWVSIILSSAMSIAIILFFSLYKK